MKSHAEPQLKAPGAGLPFPESLIARAILWARCRSGDVASFTSSIIEERRRIEALIEDKADAMLSQRVLIPRLRGLEDSSRYWSVWMTLDHLRIVNAGFASILEALASNRIPDRVVRTESVKPDAHVAETVVAEYEVGCDALLQTISAITNFSTKVTHAHPWFGRLDAHAWLALSGVHMSIHRKQIEMIFQHQA